LAIDPSVRYSTQVDTSDPTGYPHGKAQDSTALGDGAGFPLEKDWVNDVLGFEQALLAAVGATPSGTPDKVGASQYLGAIVTLIASATGAVSDAATAALKREQVQNWTMAAWNFFGATTQDSGILWIPEGTTGNGSWLLFGNITGPANVSGRLPSSQPGGVPSALNATNPPLTEWRLTTSSVNGATVVAGGGSSSSDTVAAVSTDFGWTWSSHVVHAAANWRCNGLVYDPVHGRFIFIAASPFGTLAPIYTSPDGITWTQRTNPASALAGATADQLFVGQNGEACVISSDGKMSVSTDGGASWSAFVATPITGVINGAYTSTYGWILIGTTQIAKTLTLATPAWTVDAPFGNSKAVDIAGDTISRYVVAHKDVSMVPGPGVQVSYNGGVSWEFQRFDSSSTTDYVPKSIKYNGAEWAVLGAPTGGGANTFAVWLSLQIR
jgi:hypothetical protein